MFIQQRARRPSGPVGPSPAVSQDFLTNTAPPAWLDNSGTVGNRMMFDATGKLTYAPANLLLNSATLSTQSVTVAIGASYIVSFQGTGSVALSGAATATINGTGVSDRVFQKVTATTASMTLTVTGSVTSAQLEPVTYQTTPAAYVATTSSAYYGLRFDYNPANLSARGLLIEASRINLAPNSRNLSTTWTVYNITRSASSEGPDGVTASAQTFLATAGSNIHVVQNAAITSASNSTYSISVFAKAGTSSFICLTLAGSAANIYISAVFDLSAAGSTATQTSAGSTSGTIVSTLKEDIGGGWFRLSLVGSHSSASSFPTIGFAQAATGNTFTTSGYCTFNAAGTETITLYGAQFELGGFATSYIPTAASSVTRVADIVRLTGASLPPIQDTAGSVLEEMLLYANTGAIQYGVFGNSVSPAYFTSALAVSATNGTNVLASGQTAVVGTPGRAGLAWGAGGRSISYSGSAAVSDVNGFGTIGSTIYVGSNNGANSINGWVRSMSFYTQQLTDTQLASKTTVGGPL